MHIPRFFQPQELVPKKVHTLFTVKEHIYRLFDERLLITLDFVRELFTPHLAGRGLVCNNWARGGGFHNRGWRPRTSTVGAPMSTHRTGEGCDVCSPVMSVSKMIEVLEANRDKLPFPIRVQRLKNGRTPTYLHIDVRVPAGTTQKITYFNA